MVVNIVCRHITFIGYFGFKLLQPTSTRAVNSVKYGCVQVFASNFSILHVLTLQVVFIRNTIECPTMCCSKSCNLVLITNNVCDKIIFCS